jgi:hypothetical protein
MTTYTLSFDADTNSHVLSCGSLHIATVSTDTLFGRNALRVIMDELAHNTRNTVVNENGLVIVGDVGQLAQSQG